MNPFFKLFGSILILAFATWQGETGFDEPADHRYGAMLAFVDVNAPLIGNRSFGIKQSQL